MQSVRLGLQLSMRSEIHPTPPLSSRETRFFIVRFHIGLQLSMRNELYSTLPLSQCETRSIFAKFHIGGFRGIIIRNLSYGIFKYCVIKAFSAKVSVFRCVYTLVTYKNMICLHFLITVIRDDCLFFHLCSVSQVEQVNHKNVNVTLK